MAEATVLIKRGYFRTQLIKNQTFKLLKGLTVGGRSGEQFLTVDGIELSGLQVARIKVKSTNDYEIHGEMTSLPPIVRKSPKARIASSASKTLVTKAAFEDDMLPEVETTETDEEIIARTTKRFDTLNKLTLGCRQGYIRSLVVTGAPGVGKTFGVEKTLSELGMLERLADDRPAFEIVSGAMSPIGLYMMLYKHCEEGHVLVLDDCDDVFNEEGSLNLLKAALDTGERRRLYWNLDSRLLAKSDIPDSFEFKGSIIFISNLNFKRVRSQKLRAHLAALMSRAHFLDLTVHTFRERILRIRHVMESTNMLSKFNISEKTVASVTKFLEENAHDFNELSLRTAIKLVQLNMACNENEEEWQDMARQSLIGNSLGY